MCVCACVCVCVCMCVCVQYRSVYSFQPSTVIVYVRIYTLQEEWKLFYEEFAMSDSEKTKVGENLSPW